MRRGKGDSRRGRFKKRKREVLEESRRPRKKVLEPTLENNRMRSGLLHEEMNEDKRWRIKMERKERKFNFKRKKGGCQWKERSLF